MVKQKSHDRTTRYSGNSYTNEIKIDISFLLVGWVTAYRGLAVGGRNRYHFSLNSTGFEYKITLGLR
jgi:hypothetical protein